MAFLNSMSRPNVSKHSWGWDRPARSWGCCLICKVVCRREGALRSLEHWRYSAKVIYGLAGSLLFPLLFRSKSLNRWITLHRLLPPCQRRWRPRREASNFRRLWRGSACKANKTGWYWWSPLFQKHQCFDQMLRIDVFWDCLYTKEFTQCLVIICRLQVMFQWICEIDSDSDGYLKETYAFVFRYRDYRVSLVLFSLRWQIAEDL